MLTRAQRRSFSERTGPTPGSTSHCRRSTRRGPTTARRRGDSASAWRATSPRRTKRTSCA